MKVPSNYPGPSIFGFSIFYFALFLSTLIVFLLNVIPDLLMLIFCPEARLYTFSILTSFIQYSLLVLQKSKQSSTKNKLVILRPPLIAAIPWRTPLCTVFWIKHIGLLHTKERGRETVDLLASILLLVQYLRINYHWWLSSKRPTSHMTWHDQTHPFAYKVHFLHYSFKEISFNLVIGFHHIQFGR